MKHNKRWLTAVVAGAVIAGAVPAFAGANASPVDTVAAAEASPPQLSVLASYNSGSGEAGAEIVAFDTTTASMLVTNGVLVRVDIVSLADPASPALVRTLDLSGFGSSVQSVAVAGGVGVAVVGGATVLDKGKAVFFDVATGEVRSSVEVGVLPDSVTFNAKGDIAVVANEGEPRCVTEGGRTPTTDPLEAENPEGSVTVISVRNRGRWTRAQQVTFGRFNSEQKRAALIGAGVRVGTWPGSTVAEDLEPESATIVGDKAYVTLQENDAMAVINLASLKVIDILPLGTKDYASTGEVFDASDKDLAFNQQVWPVHGMYMPDGIASMTAPWGQPLLLMANEGDTRSYYSGMDNAEVAGQGCFTDEARVKDLPLDPGVFGDTATLQAQAALGRLKVSAVAPSHTAAGLYDSLASFGGRSLSIRDLQGKLIWDSGSMFEAIVHTADPTQWVTSATTPAWATAPYDSRSDDKGPEPEGVVVGRHRNRQYAFVGLERAGGVVMLDVSRPTAPQFVQWATNGGDISPEGLAFVPAGVAPGGKALLLAANEISGTTTVFQLD